MARDAKNADELDGSEPREQAIPLLLEAHGGRLYSLGLRFCGHREDAQDLVQEVFLQAFRKWDQFAGRARASTWLYTIAARACQRFRRRKSGEPARLESLDASLEAQAVLGDFAAPSLAVVPDDGELSAGLRAEARQEVEQAIAALPAAFRLPLVLKEIVGFSVEEVAEVLGLRPATVKTRLHRARLRVRAALASVLPRREMPPALFSRRVCLDLLRAKQEALDRGARFEFPGRVVCERCAEFFATLDLAEGLCTDLARGELPATLREALLAEMRAS